MTDVTALPSTLHGGQAPFLCCPLHPSQAETSVFLHRPLRVDGTLGGHEEGDPGPRIAGKGSGSPRLPSRYEGCLGLCANWVPRRRRGCAPSAGAGSVHDTPGGRLRRVCAGVQNGIPANLIEQE